jgi:glycosyltransferase involved in cell wall biosynthesis
MDDTNVRSPRFSILTPAFNAAATLARAIESVLAQTCEDWEHVIVDDGSADGTLAVARSYAERDSRIRVFDRPHRGLALTRQETMRCATGDLFVRLDADDELTPEYLEKVDRLFVAHPDAQIVSTNGYQVFPGGRRVYYYTDPVFQKVSSLSISDMLRGQRFGTSAVMTRGVFEMTGGPRPEARSEDLDLWMRAVAMGATHYHLPEPVFLYHQSGKGQLSADARKVWRSHIEILEHLIGEGLLSEDDVRLARRTRRGYRLRLAARWDLWGTPLRRALAGSRRA